MVATSAASRSMFAGPAQLRLRGEGKTLDGDRVEWEEQTSPAMALLGVTVWGYVCRETTAAWERA